MKPVTRRCISLIVLLLISSIVDFAVHGSAYGFQKKCYTSSLHQTTYAVADHLEANLIHRLNRGLPILSSSFINLDDMTSTSSFGKLLGGQIASRFSQHGYKVIDLGYKKEELVIRKRDGKTALSRDMRTIGSSHNAQAIIIGTYVVSNDLAYVSVKILGTSDNSILTSYDFTMCLDETLKTVAKNNTAKKELRPSPLKVQKKSLKETETAQKKSLKKRDNTDQNGPFATGTIVLNPGNRLSARIIQSRLAKLGFYTSKIDGKWKRFSREALKAFKTERGLRYKTRWDMNTQKALFRGTGQ